MEMVPKQEADAMHAAGIANSDGTVTIDLCLQCRVRRAHRIRHPEA
jgi:hypothetical protein